MKEYLIEFTHNGKRKKVRQHGYNPSNARNNLKAEIGGSVSFIKTVEAQLV